MVGRATVGLAALVALVAASLWWPAQAEAGPVRVLTTRVTVTSKGVKPSKKAVKAAVARQASQLASCFKGALKEKRKYTGWLWLTFTYNRAGNVRKPTISSTVGDRITKMCVQMNMKRWNVGKGAGGNATVTAKIKK